MTANKKDCHSYRWPVHKMTDKIFMKLHENCLTTIIFDLEDIYLLVAVYRPLFIKSFMWSGLWLDKDIYITFHAIRTILTVISTHAVAVINTLQNISMEARCITLSMKYCCIFSLRWKHFLFQQIFPRNMFFECSIQLFLVSLSEYFHKSVKKSLKPIISFILNII